MSGSWWYIPSWCSRFCALFHKGKQWTHHRYLDMNDKVNWEVTLASFLLLLSAVWKCYLGAKDWNFAECLREGQMGSLQVIQRWYPFDASKRTNSFSHCLYFPVTVSAGWGAQPLRAQLLCTPISRVRRRSEKTVTRQGERTTCLPTSFLASWKPGGAKEHLLFNPVTALVPSSGETDCCF